MSEFKLVHRDKCGLCVASKSSHEESNLTRAYDVGVTVTKALAQNESNLVLIKLELAIKQRDRLLEAAKEANKLLYSLIDENNNPTWLKLAEAIAKCGGK